jgi:hypothetical protein
MGPAHNDSCAATARLKAKLRTAVSILEQSLNGEPGSKILYLRIAYH